MKHLSLLLALTVSGVSLMAADVASAQDLDNLDEPQGKKKKDKKKKEEAVIASDEIVREIERGLFIKANAGMSAWLLRYGSQGPGLGSMVRPGSTVALTLGQDFVDEPNRSMAWEVILHQGVHNGMDYREQAALARQGLISQADFMQGDTRTFALMAAYEFSGYPSRRLGVGFRAGAGVMLTPLLMQSQLYTTEVEGEAWGTRSTFHSSPHIPVFAGPTIEYYTKLSHFSVGIDADVGFIVDIQELTVNTTGFMKYTF